MFRKFLDYLFNSLIMGFSFRLFSLLGIGVFVASGFWRTSAVGLLQVAIADGLLLVAMPLWLKMLSNMGEARILGLFLSLKFAPWVGRLLQLLSLFVVAALTPWLDITTVFGSIGALAGSRLIRFAISKLWDRTGETWLMNLAIRLQQQEDAKSGR